MAREQALAKQKEALKSKVSKEKESTPKTPGSDSSKSTKEGGANSSKAGPKKQLTLETDNLTDGPADKEPQPAENNDDDDEFQRSETPPMTKE